jgi:hypothetical protein
VFNEHVEIETFNTTEDDEEDARVAAATYMAFQIIEMVRNVTNMVGFQPGFKQV